MNNLIQSKEIFKKSIDLKIGRLIAIASITNLHAVLWNLDSLNHKTKKHIKELPETKNNAIIEKTISQLNEYFDLKRKDFDLPISYEGTAFQQAVWKQLTTIPYGRTISYKEQAIALGDAKKARAVGTANGKNPLSIIIPCHRVIASNQTLGGYAGGLDVKKFLIDLEASDA